MNEFETVSLFSGIDLRYVEINSQTPPMQYNSAKPIIQIDYCKSGQMAYGNKIYLSPGDFSLHSVNLCKDLTVTFPTGQYSGLAFFIDLRESAANPPELLKDTNIFSETLQKKYCLDGTVSFFAGNEQTEGIFSGFYCQSEDLLLPYQKIKTLELLMYLHKPKSAKQSGGYQPENIETIREIHNRLINKIGERVTIEELAKEYLINPTTLKNSFKAVYGTSIAAHIKEHRMKMAAEMLRDTDMSIAEIAQAVGYDSQSKFTAAFKKFYRVLPKEYKKK